MLPVALSIAGSDPSGGAGIQADLKTFHRHGAYGCAVVTLLTVQNTRGVTRVDVMDAALVQAQLGAVLDDIPPAAVKTGALGSVAIVEAIAARLATSPAPLVVDPVIAPTRGGAFLNPDGQRALVTHLLPRAVLVTPNLAEAAALSGRAVASEADAREAARAIADLGARAVLVKGGHLDGDAIDTLYVDGRFERFVAPRVVTRHTHGVGCALSAAITALLARGVPLRDACAGAKQWVSAALASAPGLGAGNGPINHSA